MVFKVKGYMSICPLSESVPLMLQLLQVAGRGLVSIAGRGERGGGRGRRGPSLGVGGAVGPLAEWGLGGGSRGRCGLVST